MTQGHDAERASHWMTILVMVALALAVSLVPNALAGYGYFRDELYYIACSKRLAAGYVDQPPLSIFILAVARRIVGDSVFAIRLVPGVLAGVSVGLIGLLARRMGGGRAAIVLSSLAFLAAPQILSFHTYFSMNSLDIFFWLLAVHALLGAAEHGGLKAWLWLGLVLGLGLLNKTSVMWLGAGVASAILFTGLRSQLKTPRPYMAAAVAIAVFSPFVIWNALHGWPHIEFMQNATEEKYSSLTRGRFLADQFLAMNPFTYLVSLPGLAWCLTHKDRRYISVTFLTVFGILLANPHVKAEYMAAAYPMLLACGGISLERLGKPWRSLAVWAIPAILVVSGAILAPLGIPILPVDSYPRYSQTLGVAPSTAENEELEDLPQFFADMHGWEDLARNVSKAYMTIPEAERATTVAFVTNYGEAGALELYARRYPLPRVICNHNSYWFWGVGPLPVTTFIRLGGSQEGLSKSYGTVTAAGVHTCEHCMPYENNLQIFIARDRQVPIDIAWPQIKHFE